MRYVIDACNLIFRHRRLEETLEQRGFPAARTLLVAMLSRFAHAERAGEIVAVFDGSEKAAHRPRMQREAAGLVQLIYADPREEADRFIIDMVENSRHPGEIIVISSDKFVATNAQRGGAHTMSCREFLSHMRAAIQHAADPLRGEDPRKFTVGGLTPREIEEWEKWMREHGGRSEP